MKKVTYIIFALLLTGTINGFSQAIIQGETGTAEAHEGASLDLATAGTTDKGMLMPSVSIDELTVFGLEGSTEASVILEGKTMIVYNTNASTGKGFHYWNGTQWIPLSQQECPDFVKDYEGNVYTAKRFGNQCWMTQNSRSILDEYGGVIAGVKLNPGAFNELGGAVNVTWSDGNILYTPGDVPSAQYTENGVAYDLPYDDYASKSGFHYPSYQASLACPEGWLLPTDKDWGVLVATLGSSPAKKMKANNWEYISIDSRTNNWGGYPPGDENNSGFNAFPTGSVYSNGTSANYFTHSTFWWSSDDSYATTYVHFSATDTQLWYNYNSILSYFSVRCFKNIEAIINN